MASLQQIPDWRTFSLRTPLNPGDLFPLMVDRGGRGEVHRRTILLAALCTLAAILLVWTGFALAWRRFFGRKSSAQ